MLTMLRDHVASPSDRLDIGSEVGVWKGNQVDLDAINSTGGAGQERLEK